jgi:hypothetical protein
MLGDVTWAAPLAGELGGVGDAGVGVGDQQPTGGRDPL